MAGRRRARRVGAVRACAVVSLAVLAALGLAGCAGEVGDPGADAGVDPANPCSQGAPETETLTDPGFVGEPPADAMAWQESAGALAGELTALAGDRLGGVWLVWEPERALALRLTAGPELPEVQAAADASGLLVDIQYTAPVSADALAAAAAAVSDQAAEVPGVGGWSIDQLNGRLLFQVASADDGGAATCSALVEILDPAGVPYAFDVFDGPSESTVRTTVAVTEARAPAGPTVDLFVASCNGDPEVTALVQSPDDVRIEVTSTVPAPGWGGDDCLDGLTVTLDAPLGDRTLIDLTTGEQVPASPQTG